MKSLQVTQKLYKAIKQGSIIIPIQGLIYDRNIGYNEYNRTLIKFVHSVPKTVTIDILQHEKSHGGIIASNIFSICNIISHEPRVNDVCKLMIASSSLFDLGNAVNRIELYNETCNRLYSTRLSLIDILVINKYLNRSE